MELVFEHSVPLEREAVFAFHRKPRHLELVMAGWKPFRLICCGDSIEPGSETWVEEHSFGILPIVLGYRHVLYQPPERFGEELIHGPFSRFFHVHEFEQDGEDGTIVRDSIDVTLPWHYGGAAAVRRLVAPRLRRAFALRGENLRRLAADGTISRILSERCGAPSHGDTPWKQQPGCCS